MYSKAGDFLIYAYKEEEKSYTNIKNVQENYTNTALARPIIQNKKQCKRGRKFLKLYYRCGLLPKKEASCYSITFEFQRNDN